MNSCVMIEYGAGTSRISSARRVAVPALAAAKPSSLSVFTVNGDRTTASARPGRVSRAGVAAACSTAAREGTGASGRSAAALRRGVGPLLSAAGAVAIVTARVLASWAATRPVPAISCVSASRAVSMPFTSFVRVLPTVRLAKITSCPDCAANSLSDCSASPAEIA